MDMIKIEKSKKNIELDFVERELLVELLKKNIRKKEKSKKISALEKVGIIGVSENILYKLK
jgi:hypothetical protein